MDQLIAGLNRLPPRPRRPVRPRRPRETFRRTECVWSSEDDDILLSDVLLLIPTGIRADDIRICVERNAQTGYTLVTVTYDHDIPNTRFQDQLRDYEERMRRYEIELPEWSRRNAEWLLLKQQHDSEIQQLSDQIAEAFVDADDIIGDVI